MKHIAKIKIPGNNLLMDKYLSIKMNPSNWVGTNNPVIIPFSIHSAFHENEFGFEKIQALVTLVRNSVKNNITILLCDWSHLNARSLIYNGDKNYTAKKCILDAKEYHKKFNALFDSCEVVYWSNFVNEDNLYESFKSKIMNIYHNDLYFQEMIKKDMEKLNKNKNVIKESELYQKESIQDLLEQCIYLMIAANKKYSFEFYIGKRNLTANYINEKFCDSHLTRVNVHIKISEMAPEKLIT